TPGTLLPSLSADALSALHAFARAVGVSAALALAPRGGWRVAGHRRGPVARGPDQGAERLGSGARLRLSWPRAIHAPLWLPHGLGSSRARVAGRRRLGRAGRCGAQRPAA